MNKFCHNKLQAFLLMAVLVCLFPLDAQPRQACKADVAKLCSKTKPGQGRVKACLEARQNELSTGCKQQIARWKSISAACKSDREKYCPDQKGPDLKMCIKAKRSKFSDTCKSAVKAARGK